ncbi:MAG TPA: hypothetical protein VIM98_01320 [Dyella sp.]|uniref:hypothetical protein n=1 Tax=Dyella sp. TaxID=1869338 RepID=UPI002F9259A4
MAHNYISEAEKYRLEENKRSKDALDRVIAEKNASLVGYPKEYNGIIYQMKQNGMYVCLNASQNGKLAGLFSSPQAIKKLVDDMEKAGEIKL